MTSEESKLCREFYELLVKTGKWEAVENQLKEQAYQEILSATGPHEAHVTAVKAQQIPVVMSMIRDALNQ